MSKQVKEIRNTLLKEFRKSTKCHEWFVDEHVLVVEKLALELCKHYPEANKDAVLLSVWFHDIGRIHGISKDHDVYGADYAKEYLSKKSFSTSLIDIIYQACRSHRCKDVLPQSIEAKIIATSDALSHFHNGFYLRILYSKSRRGKDFQEIRKKILKKIDRDYKVKISLPIAKEATEPFYRAWKQVIKEISL